MAEPRPIVIPPIQLNYQSSPTPETPDNVTVLALDPMGLPSYRRKFVAFRAAWAAMVVPVISAVFLLTGLWQVDVVAFLMGAAGWGVIAVGIAAFGAWRDITRVWGSFRVTMDELTITRTAKGRRTMTLSFRELRLAQFSFLGGLVLRDEHKRMLVIPREIVGWALLESRVQQQLPIQPARITLKMCLELALPLIGALLVVPPAAATWFLTSKPTVIALSIVGSISTIVFATYLLRNKNLGFHRKVRVAITCAIILVVHAVRLAAPSFHL